MRIFSAILFIVFSALSAMAADEVRREILVEGVGQVEAAPDMARIQIGVVKEARLATQALAAASAATADVLEMLAASGVEARDIQTRNVRVSPRYDRRNDGSAPRIVGYVASNDLNVTVRDLDDLGTLLDAVVADGATNLGRLSFDVADPEPLLKRARVIAVQDAIGLANELADAAGVKLGPLMRLRESRGGGGYVLAEEPIMMEARSSVPIASGEVTFEVGVSATFAIAE